MDDEQELPVGQLHADDLGRITRYVDPNDRRRQVVGKLVAVNHTLIGVDLHTTVTLQYSRSAEAITVFMPSDNKLLFGPPVASQAELIS